MAATRVAAEVGDTGLSRQLLAAPGCPSTPCTASAPPAGPSLDGLRGVLPDLALTMLPGAGHLHPLLEPERFVDALRPAPTGQHVSAGAGHA